MKKETVLLILVLMFLFSALIVTSSAQEREAGVNAGDWFKYSGFDVNWSSDDPNATVPTYVKVMNETEWMKFTIVSVIGTNVTAQAVIHFKNGTEDAGDLWRDVDAGEGEGFMAFWAPISANLNANDTIWSSEGFFDWRINETVIQIYPDGARETNYIDQVHDETPYDYAKTVYYWDRPTGIPVDAFYEQEEGMEYLSYSVRIIESNVWLVPEFPLWVSILLLFIVLTVATVIYKRRLLKTPIH